MTEADGVLKRALRRDAILRRAGRVPDPRTEADLAGLIVERKLIGSEAAREWLIATAATEDEWVARSVGKSVRVLLEGGYAEDAAKVFSSLLGMENEEGGSRRRRSLFASTSLLRDDLESVLQSSSFISKYPQIWGESLVRLQSLLISDKEEEEGARSKEMFPSGDGAGHLYPLHYFHYQADLFRNESWYTVTVALDDGLAEAAGLSLPGPFRVMADALMRGDVSLAVCQPLVALYDCENLTKSDSWQGREAIKVLGRAEVVESAEAFPWRRLLRNRLLPSLDRNQHLELLAQLQKAYIEDRRRVNELADLEALGILAKEEVNLVAEARHKGELFGPYDPREQYEDESASYVGRSAEERAAERWPFREDRDAIKTLVEEQRKRREDDSEANATLRQRLEALKVVVNRPEHEAPEWLGEILGWCTRAIRDIKADYRLQVSIDDSENIDPVVYIGLLQKHAPWWRQIVETALRKLDEDVPVSHDSHTQGHLAWGSNDPIAGSLNLLDEILASSAESKLEPYRESLSETILRVWESWPGYTRGLAMAILRPYHWANCKKLDELLVQAVAVDTSAQNLSFALNHLLRVGQQDICPLMRTLVRRLDDVSDAPKLAQRIGELIGNAVARHRGDGEKFADLVAISEWFDELSADPSEGGASRSLVASGIVIGARHHLETRGALLYRHAETWLSLVIWVLDEWLSSTGDDSNHLPVQPIGCIRKLEWGRKEKKFLLSQLGEVVVRIISEADLGAFYNVHYELQGLLREATEGGEHESLLDDSLLIRVCRGSAERVARWQEEGRTTNDLAYVHSLSGRTTSELVSLVIEVVRDREFARRQLAPVVDLLADVGLREIAGRLRTKLRRS